MPGESTPAKRNHWLKVHLKGDGKTVNSAAIGTQVRLAIDNKLLTRQVEGGTGAGSQHDLTLHFGLGEHAGPVNLQILAAGGASSTIKGVAVDQTVTYMVSKTAVTAEFELKSFSGKLDSAKVLVAVEIGDGQVRGAAQLLGIQITAVIVTAQ